jgi:hypothetical protein
MTCVRILSLALLGLSLGGCREPRPFTPAEKSASLELQEWLEIWRTEIPDLSVDSFEFVRGGDFNPRAGREIDYAEYISEYLHVSWETQRRNVQISPDGRWALDHLIFNAFGRDGKVYAGLGPDTQVVLIDLGTMDSYYVFQCGTPCSPHRPIWVSSEVFLLLWSADEHPEGFYLRISRFDIGSGESATFRGPEISRRYNTEAGSKLRRWNYRRYSDMIW